MKSCVTISLVNEARGGPFVYWDDLATSCHKAAELGYDAVEIFPPGPEAIPVESLKATLETCGLQLAAVGTGAGWVKHGLTLTHANSTQRAAARVFIESIIDVAGQFGASAIIGSMQGRFGGEVDNASAIGYLRDALVDLGQYAAKYNVPLIYEPLNRYETNLCNRLADGAELLDHVPSGNVVLLADLFHMNIEEDDLAAAIRSAAKYIGHVHFVDSNRQPAGSGHMQYEPIIAALQEIGYEGYLSAEAFPLPDPDSAAKLTIDAFRQLTA